MPCDPRAARKRTWLLSRAALVVTTASTVFVTVASVDSAGAREVGFCAVVPARTQPSLAITSPRALTTASAARAALLPSLHATPKPPGHPDSRPAHLPHLGPV